jgi:hypothetical protein
MMKKKDFYILNEINIKGSIILLPDSDFALEIYKANIPYRPGVYLVYALDEKGEDNELLYYGKAGVTENNGNPMLNFHQLPKRLVATTSIPTGHPDYNPNKRKDITRAKLWPWFVKTKFVYGIKIYWFVTEWPQQNPNDIEKRIKSVLKLKYPKWQKAI